MQGPAVCPNGHAMDDGLFNCPCCGAYRPSAHDPAALIRNGRVVGVKPRKRDRCKCGGFWRGGVDGPYAVCASCGAMQEDGPYA